MLIVSALLERGDLFRFGDTGTTYRVLRIGGGRVYFTPDSGGHEDHSVGIKSKQRLTLIDDEDFGDPKKLKDKMEILVPQGKYIMMVD